MRFFGTLNRWSTSRNLLLSIIATIVVIALLGYSTQALVYSIYGDYTMPDTRFGYTFAEIQVVFDGLGVEGLRAWSTVHLLDYIFPITYMLAMIFSLGLQLKRLNYSSSNYNRVLLLPILGCIADYVENILVQTQVLAYPNLSANVISLASYVTISKWLFLGLGFGAIIVLLLVIIYQKFSAKAQ